MKISYLFITLCATIFFSCAENPSPVVDSFGGFSSVNDIEPTDSVKINSLVFKGTDFFGQSCDLSLSIREEDGKEVFLAKMDYIIHGQALPSIKTDIFLFDISSNTYSDPVSGNGAVTFGGAILKDRATADLNSLASYEASGDLIYSLRIETNASDSADYKNALEQVVDDPNQLAAFSSTLDQINRIVFKIAHAGHYDAAGCVGLKLTNVVEEEIKI